MTLQEVQKECKEYLKLLVDEGRHICDRPDILMDGCRNCGYSAYWHLVKKVALAEDTNVPKI